MIRVKKKERIWKYDNRYSPQINMGLMFLQDDANIPIDQRSEGGCMYYVDIGACGKECPRYVEGNCEIEEEINEL